MFFNTKISIFLLTEKEYCPNGYELFEAGGDVSGVGMLDLHGKHIEADIERCADICENNIQCRAFLYSKKWGQCKLSAYENPNEHKYEDWIFCQRIGNHILSQLLILKS